MSFKIQIEKAIKRGVRELFDLDLDPALEHPREEKFGDYATGVALQIASRETRLDSRRFVDARREKDPLKIAQKLRENLITQLPSYLVTQIDVVKPGFINLRLRDKVLMKEADKIVEEGDDYGRLDGGKGKTILIDYSSPNIARPFGVGHLRSTIIGQALCNLYSFAGWKVVGINYLGDWGTQFGKLIYALLTWGDEKKLNGMERPTEELQRLYVKFHNEANKDPHLEEKAREWFKRLEDGDKEANRLWKKFRAWSIAEFERIYDLLGVHIDKTSGESQVVSKVGEVIKEAQDAGLATESKGALVVSIENEDVPPLMLLKSDGATTYEARDLAAIKARKVQYRPDRILYETGVDHRLHFKKIFWVAEALGYGGKDQFVHIAHGLYRLPKGKISTRAGRTIRLEEVLEEAVAKARKVVEEKSASRRTSSQRAKVSRAVGIGAVKYNDLSQHYSTEVVFDWEKMLSLEGNSAPYLQYTYARAKSVLEKSGKKRFLVTQLPSYPVTSEELPVLRYIYRFPEVVEDAVVSNSPNLVCNFLFELAQRFNTFYARVPVIRAKSVGLRELRLGLTAATAQVIKNGLTLLGIKTLERL
jgi:arginyl-tRNA synthetase